MLHLVDMEKRRLFFGAEVFAPWPPLSPPGRVIESSSLHLTLAFLGNVALSSIEALLPTFPKPSFHLGLPGCLDTLLFLPEQSPRTVSAHVKLFSHEIEWKNFILALGSWLSMDLSSFLPHVTFARSPFHKEDWEKFFTPLPLIIQGFHLYESVGSLTYTSLWHYPLLPPFEEIEHTADIAFLLRGETLAELYLHAQLALAFSFPPLVRFLPLKTTVSSLSDIIIDLNALLAEADMELGAPFKAVSFHGTVQQKPQEPLTWEMIVDV